MLHRSVLIALTCAATWGISSNIVARAFFEPDNSRSTPLLLAQSATPPSIDLFPEEESADPASPAEPPTSQSSESLSRAEQQARSIRNLQMRLTQLGYYEGAIDGIYGPGTRSAVSEFQQDAGIEATGIVDRPTIEALRNPPSSIQGEPSAGDRVAPSSEPSESENAASGSDAPEDDTGLDDTELDTTALDEALSEPDSTLDGGETDSNTSSDADVTEEGDAATDTDTAPASEGMGSIIFVGLAVLLLGILGGGILLLLSRRPTEESAALPDSDDNLPPATSGGTEEPNSEAAPEYNGSREEAIAHRTASLANLPTQETAEPASRLARVNIIDELIQDLQSPDPAARRRAIWELGQRGNSAAIQPLTTLMLDADSKERSLILAALAEIGSQTLKPMNRALALSLQDENPEVRKNAIRDLTRIYALMDQAGQLLGHATDDSNPEVRQTAHWAVNQLHRVRFKATETSPAALTGDSPIDAHPQDSSSHSNP